MGKLADLPVRTANEGWTWGRLSGGPPPEPLLLITEQPCLPVPGHPSGSALLSKPGRVQV